jgi:hypothetical protein
MSATALANLKLVAAKKPGQMSPVAFRRAKLAKRLAEQISLAKAMSDGSTYAPTKQRKVTDAESGETKIVDVPKRIKAWWWSGEGGKFCVSLRYGAKVIELAKGKSAVEVGSSTELIAALETLKLAVTGGELDAQLEAASGAVKAGFKK